MPGYKIAFARSTRKELEKLPPSLSERILDRIENLGSTPRPAGSLKLKGKSGLWRLRVGDYRIVCAIDDQKKTSISLSSGTARMFTAIPEL